MPKVMYVDDHVHNIRLVKMMLGETGCEVIGFGRAAQALEYIEQNTIDMLLVDLTMPFIDGITIIRSIRADPKHSEIPIVVITASADNNDRYEAIEAGANEYIKKPFDRPMLISLVNKYLL